MNMNKELYKSLIAMSIALTDTGEFGRVAIIDSAIQIIKKQEARLFAAEVENAQMRRLIDALHDRMYSFRGLARAGEANDWIWTIKDEKVLSNAAAFLASHPEQK
jgi:hypothetical protein